MRPIPAILRARRAVLALALLLLATAAVLPARASADGMNVGFLSLGLSLPEEGLRLDVNVWYPTAKRGSRNIVLQSWTFRAAAGAAPAEGKFPLILLSHSSAGTRFSMHDTARALASEGFVVAAPTHPLDNLDNMPQFHSWALFARRCADLSGLVDVILENKTVGPAVDPSRVGLLGYGAGATAGLLLGGARPECGDFDAWCGDFDGRREDPRDVYCNRWARERVARDLCPSLPPRKSLADRRVGAVAAVNPDFPMLFPAKALKDFRLPLLLVLGSSDEARGREELAELAGRFPRPPETLFLKDADLGALTSECPDDLKDELPELCRSVDAQARSAIRDSLGAALADFFSKTLVRGDPRPQEPEAAEQEEPAEIVGPPLPPEDAGKSGRRGKSSRRRTGAE